MSDEAFLRSLELGTMRVAYKNQDNDWTIDTKVKQQILDIFKKSKTINMGSAEYCNFLDKELLKPRLFSHDNNVRIVPGGTSIRAGSYIGQSVVIMPPAYVNIGAYVDDSTMIDSHVLVGSCAQIGKRVHLSAGVQIGGVLEPIGKMPVIVEDYCFIGADAILTEGVLVRERAVIAPGVVLSASIPVYDIVKEKVYKGEVPEGAVVVPGTRPVNSVWASEQGLSLYCAVIVKYRDEKTEHAIELEMALRQNI